MAVGENQFEALWSNLHVASHFCPLASVLEIGGEQTGTGWGPDRRVNVKSPEENLVPVIQSGDRGRERSLLSRVPM